MPILRNRAVLEVYRNIKVFLNLEAGVTRGEVPDPWQPASREGNEQVRERLEETERELSRLRAELAQVNGAASRSPGGGPPKFFLVGRSKSGTSWLMGLLNSHPEIMCRGEGKFFGKDSHKSLHGALAHSERLQTWLGRNPWTWQDQDPDLGDLLGVAVSYLMEEKLKKAKKRIVGDKTPLENVEVVEEIATICPGSKVIHIIRDGRDVAVSTIHHRWNSATDRGGGIRLTPKQIAKREAYRSNPSAFGASGESIFSDGEVAEVAKNWRTFVSRAIQDGPKLLGGDYHQLHYEDLLTEPVAKVRRVLEFLGADSSEKIAQKCIEAVSFERKASRKPGEEDPNSFYRKGVSGDWKGVYTKEDRQAFKEEAGDLLIELGYEKDYNW